MGFGNLLNGKERKIIRSRVVDGFGLSSALKGDLGYWTEYRIIDKKTGRLIESGHNTTVLGGRIAQLEELFGLTKNEKQHLLINETLGVPHSESSNVLKSATLKRQTEYFMVGDGAVSQENPGKFYSPKNYETRLYNPIPFRMVPAASETSLDTSNLRLRKELNINGTSYVAYYAKKFDPGVLILEYNGAEYIPQSSDTVRVDENDTLHRLSGGSVLAYIQFYLDVEENEMKEYFRITNGSLDAASMSEVGLVLAADLPNSLDGNRSELAAAELTAKITSNSVSLSTEGSSRQIQYRIYAR